MPDIFRCSFLLASSGLLVLKRDVLTHQYTDIEASAGWVRERKTLMR